MKKFFTFFLLLTFACISIHAQNSDVMGKFSYKNNDGYTCKIMMLKDGTAIFDSIESDFTQNNDGRMKTSKGAFFFDFTFWQQWGQFGVLFDENYYIVSTTLGSEDYADFSFPISFDPAQMTIHFSNYQGERRELNLLNLPSDQKFHVQDLSWD